MRDTAADVIAWCSGESQKPTADRSFQRLAKVPTALGAELVPGYPDAWTAWTKSDQHDPDEPIPPGAPIYWKLFATSPSTGIRKNYGHVAIADTDDGFCWSIDIVRHGSIDRVKRRTI